MTKRLELHDILINVLGTQGQIESRVYFQPPSTVKMSYPCIIYSRNQIDTTYADNKLYGYKDAYTVTVVDPDPDSEIPNRVLHLPLSSFNRHYTAENLNHDVFNIYY